MIKNSPGYEAETPVNRRYEEVLYDYYGKPKYWIGHERPASDLAGKQPGPRKSPETS
jgi:hypothetical protein